MREVTIREAGPADAATIATLFSEFNALLGADGRHGAEAFLPENVNVSAGMMAARLESMRGVETTFLAEADGFASGLCCLRMVPYIGQDVPYAEVTQLYVKAEFKRHGVGAQLLRTAEERAVGAGATCVHIITGGRNNDDAQAFYRAQGYISEDVVFNKYFTPEVAHA